MLAPIKFCGRICYSLYLVHAPVTVYVAWNCYRLGVTGTLGTILITLPIGMILSVLAGWLFHRGIELRFMNAGVKAKSTRAEIVHGRAPSEKALQLVAN
jgi:peptidoglycan/LPS O-acetylase OafA/YrhL